jgi:hypothetical protein
LAKNTICRKRVLDSAAALAGHRLALSCRWSP